MVQRTPGWAVVEGGAWDVSVDLTGRVGRGVQAKIVARWRGARRGVAVIVLCLLGAAASFCVAFALALVVRPLALRLGHVDRAPPGQPGRRTVPLGGGVAIFWAMAVPMIALTMAPRGMAALDPVVPRRGLDAAPVIGSGGSMLALLAASLLIHVAGVWDDQRPLAPRTKLVVQVLAAAPLVLLLHERVLPQWLPPAVGGALALAWLLAVTNAFNFLDGSDGLAATVGALCALLFVVPALLSGQTAEGLLFATLAGALAAFLCFNFPPASMFMGDGGSQVVGFVLGAGSLHLTYFDAGYRLVSPWYAVFTPLAVLAIPLYDLVTVVALRVAQRKSPLRGDRQHLLHRLARKGLGPRGVVAVVGASTVATGIGGVMLSRLMEWQALLVVLQTFMVLIVLALLEFRLGRPAMEVERRAALEAQSAEPARGTQAREPVP